MLTENLSVFLTDFGVDAVINGISIKGLFDDADQIMDMGRITNVQTSQQVLTVKTTDVALAGIARGQNIIINGVSHRVHNLIPGELDSALTHITITSP